MEPEHMDFEGGAGQGGHLEKKLLRCRLFVAISPLPSCVLRRVAHLRWTFLWTCSWLKLRPKNCNSFPVLLNTLFLGTQIPNIWIWPVPDKWKRLGMRIYICEGGCHATRHPSIWSSLITGRPLSPFNCEALLLFADSQGCPCREYGKDRLVRNPPFPAGFSLQIL